MAGDDASSLDISAETPLPLLYWKLPNDRSSCTSEMANYFVSKRSYVPNHPHQRDQEDHLAMIMAHAYTPLLLL